MRDPKTTPHPGDTFHFRSGVELEITGAAISVTKDGKETSCLFFTRTIGDRKIRGVASVGTIRNQIRQAQTRTVGSDSDPWTNAKRLAGSMLLSGKADKS